MFNKLNMKALLVYCLGLIVSPPIPIKIDTETYFHTEYRFVDSNTKVEIRLSETFNPQASYS